MGSALRTIKKASKNIVGALVREGDRRDRSVYLSLENWNLTALPGVGLAQGGVSLHELTLRFGSPLHVVHIPALQANIEGFCSTQTSSGRTSEVFYSYKTNPIPSVLRMLHERGVGAEVISPYEFWLAKKLGVPPEKIVYNGPSQTDSSIRDAFSYGIELLNINHRSEIERVARIARELGVRGRVGLRVSLDNGWTGQFGTPNASGEALEAFREALSNPNLEVVAVHAHRGISIRTEADAHAFVQSVLAFIDQLKFELDFIPKILDLGGSLCIPTVKGINHRDQSLNTTFGRAIPLPEPSSALKIENYVRLVLSLVEAHFERLAVPCPRVFLEPGRSMTGNTQLLVASVLNIKETKDRTFAIMDAGINHAEAVRNEYHQLFPVNRFGHPNAQNYVFVGPICSPGDVLYPSVALPKLSIGDTVAIMDSGAYFVPFSTSFSFPRPAIVLVEEGRVSVARRAETYDDLVACDTI